MEKTKVSNHTQVPFNYWPELDVMRSIAVAMMIANHFGFAFMQPNAYSDGLTAAVMFVSSFAPVLFFFITGFGAGLHYSNQSQSNSLGPTLYKGLILVCIEILVLGAGQPTSLTFDFLSFIALTMLILAVIKASKHALIYASILLFAATAFRFGVGPTYNALVPPHAQQNIWHSILGNQAMHGTSYWLIPWLAYPMAGFLLGFTTKIHAQKIKANTLKSAVIASFLSVSGLICYGMLEYLQLTFFRWSTLSFAYFLTGFAFIACSMTVCVWIVYSNKTKSITTALSLRGVSSLAAVPIHYAVINLLGNFVSKEETSGLFYILVLITLPLTFFLARKINELALYAKNKFNQRLTILAACPILLVTFIFRELEILNGWAWQLTNYSLQLVLCLLLIFSYKTKTRS